MGLFGNLFGRGGSAVADDPGIAAGDMPAEELRRGMVIVAMPEGWGDVRQHDDGTWPLIIDDPEYVEQGEGGNPCMYWTTDEPEWPDYWTWPDTLVTVAWDDDTDEPLIEGDPG